MKISMKYIFLTGTLFIKMSISRRHDEPVSRVSKHYPQYISFPASLNTIVG